MKIFVHEGKKFIRCLVQNIYKKLMEIVNEVKYEQVLIVGRRLGADE